MGAVSCQVHGSGPVQYGVITLNRAPVNALVPAITEGIVDAIDSLETDPNVNGFILTSSITGFFSAGIDLSLFVGDMDDFTRFWIGLRRAFLRIYESRLVSIACIQGHAPGGGTILALPCHYRYMLNGKAMIGLNEVAVGLPVPMWLCDVFVQTVGTRHAERLLPFGATFDAQKAKSIGLVDEVFDTTALMQDAAVAQLQRCARVNQGVRHQTQQWIRRAFADRMKDQEDLDLAAVRAAGLDPKFQATIRKVMASLASKKAAAAAKSRL